MQRLGKPPPWGEKREKKETDWLQEQRRRRAVRGTLSISMLNGLCNRLLFVLPWQNVISSKTLPQKPTVCLVSNVLHSQYICICCNVSPRVQAGGEGVTVLHVTYLYDCWSKVNKYVSFSATWKYIWERIYRHHEVMWGWWHYWWFF